MTGGTLSTILAHATTFRNLDQTTFTTVSLIISALLFLWLRQTHPAAAARFKADQFASSVPAEHIDEDAPLKVAALYVYPIKSCRGTSLKTSDYNECGLLYDRRWMIIDAKSHAMMTARQVPRLLLIEPTVDAAVGVLRIRVPGSKEIHEIPIEPPADAERLTDLKVWSSVAMDGLVVSPVGGALHKALVAHVGRDVLLVVKGESVRPAGGPGIADRLKLPTKYGAPHTAFADAWPALFASTSSLDDLRGRIETADDVKNWDAERWTMDASSFPIERFRPNVLVSGGLPWEEDGWSKVRIGDNAWVVTSRCSRCLLPNIDPETATRDQAVPSGVLSKFRKVDIYLSDANCFGVNAAPQTSSGTLRVGDRFKVTYRWGLRDDGEWARPEDGWGPAKPKRTD